MSHSGQNITHQNSRQWNAVGNCHWKSIGDFQWTSTGKGTILLKIPLRSENPLENATDNPLTNATDDPRWFLRCSFLVCNSLPLHGRFSWQDPGFSCSDSRLIRLNFSRAKFTTVVSVGPARVPCCLEIPAGDLAVPRLALSAHGREDRHRCCHERVSFWDARLTLYPPVLMYGLCYHVNNLRFRNSQQQQQQQQQCFITLRCRD